ncbi:unnamed protein product [Oppiella nova]|uniref:Major facilitator superfamily (MFS) profile domain-containing protein n=1 Tax=Oppiella nova TaxID=334625 RepID=A0A7R9LM36_9ACAR|nr:unnamed protein product [Oppiella nova]CAG2164950.1 unnamed protein product [Oppiella nova]
MTNNFTATVFAIGNTIAFTCGVITPLVIGYILEANNDTPRKQWGYVFYMSGAINICGGLVFAAFSSAKQQDWDKDPDSMSILVNALTPMIARSLHYWLLLASRVVLGMFQAFIFPSCYALFSKWAPDHERSTFLSFPTIGGNIGTIATSSLSGYLSENGFDGGWPSVFYVSAMIAMVWMILWILLVKSEPKDHPWVSHHELHYIHSNIKSNKTGGQPIKRSVPWVKICTSKAVLSVFLVKFTMNWNYVLFLLKLPAYFDTVFKYSVSKLGGIQKP